MTAYDGNTQVAQVSFAFDGIPNRYTEDVRTVSAPNITKVVLTPANADYVAYMSLTPCITPGQLDDVLSATNCCSGRADPQSIVCARPSDRNTTWVSCMQDVMNMYAT